MCSYFVKLYCSWLDWFIARKICFFHFLPIFQDFNFEPSNTEVTLWNLSCFTFMILGFISSRWLQSSLKKGHPFAKQAVNLPVGSSLQVEEVRPTLSAFNGELTPKRQALLQRKEKFACQCLGCRVCHIQTGWMIFILRGHYWWISPITYLDIISTVINTSLRVEECRYIAVISKIKLQVFAKTRDTSGEMCP